MHQDSDVSNSEANEDTINDNNNNNTKKKVVRNKGAWGNDLDGLVGKLVFYKNGKIKLKMGQFVYDVKEEWMERRERKEKGGGGGR